MQYGFFDVSFTCVNDLGAGKILSAHKGITFVIMDWLTKILKGPGHKISEGQYHGRYGDDRIWEEPSTPVVIMFLLFVDYFIYI